MANIPSGGGGGVDGCAGSTKKQLLGNSLGVLLAQWLVHCAINPLLLGSDLEAGSEPCLRRKAVGVMPHVVPALASCQGKVLVKVNTD